MPSMNSYSVSSSPSTTHGSFSHHSSEDAHNYTRLGRAMEYDLNHVSYSTSTAEHEENDTVGSFDIENEAAATSTRRFDNLLPHQMQSPSVINSNVISQHFADFTMGGLGLTDTEDSIEVGRFHHSDGHNDKSTSLPFSIGRSSDSPQNKTPNARLSNRNNENINTRSANKGFRSQSANLPRFASPLSKQPIITHHTTPKRGMSPLKNVKNQSRVLTEDESTIGLSERPPNATTTRFSGSPKDSKSTRRENNASRAREVSNQLRAAEADIVAAKRSVSGSTNGSTPPKKNLPSGFKSTEQFFAELGLDPTATTAQIAQSKIQNTRPSILNARNKHLLPNMTAQSIRLPDMTGISDLVSSYNEADTSQFDHNGLNNHRKIESIPIPADEKAIMVALGLLQEKVEALESDKALKERKIREMQKSQEQTQQLYQIESQSRRAAEAELVQRKRSDSALGTDHEGSERGERQKWTEEREKLQTKHAIERMKLENTISSQRQKLESIEQEFVLLSVSLRNTTEEKNSAASSLAVAITSKDALQRENNNLKIQLERARTKVHELENIVIEEREIMDAKLDRYREKVKRLNKTAGEATESAREATNLLRESREAYISTRPAKPQSKKGKGRAPPIEQPVEDKIHEQVQERLRKISNSKQNEQAVEVPIESAKISAPRTERQFHNIVQNTAQSKPEEVVITSKSKIRRKRVIIQEISESESDGEMEPQVELHSTIPQHNDTTFTDAETDSQEDEDADRYRHQYEMAQDTVMSLVNPSDIEYLRQQIQEERRLQEEATTAQADAEEDVTAEIQKPEPERVFVYSAEEDVTIITEPEHENEPTEKPHTAPNNNVPRVHTTVHHENNEDAQEYEHAQDIIDRLGTHDKEQCTICRRKTEMDECNVKGHSGNIIFATNHANDIPAPEIIPVSKRMPVLDHDMGWEEEATMRPSMAPKTALEKVLQQITDEFNHLKINYNNAQAEYLNMDPSLGKRKRKAMTVKMNTMVEEMDKKADQIYALYDVAELVHQDEDDDFEESISQIDEHQRERRRSETRRGDVEI